MISMTGYAYCEKSTENLSVSVEIKGYNSRYLEIYVNLPSWLSTMEMKIRSLVSSACGRGKIEIYAHVHEHNIPVKIDVNRNAVRAYYDAITVLNDELGIKEKPNLSLMLGMEGILEIEKNRDDERCWKEMEPLLQEALKTFCGEREREGKHTEEDILKHLEIIENSVKTTAAFAPVIEISIKENIKSRFNELLGSQVDENRVLSETALLLLKYTISEEISRLNSHLGEFKAEVRKNTRPGKKLDFLCQEINREINTIGSKSAIIEVSTEVVRMKEALENIREQLRNVE
ncbi:MAG: YicC family protein [Spirochaetes bacterium]|nr:YicC family protein [Brevinematales bacterium]MCL1959830.1 YicC family protein [Spirochaetota bacterium]